MNLKLSTRKQLLAERKNLGRRVTVGFAGIADLRHFIGLEYIKGMMKAASDYDINFINMGGAVKYSLFDDINFISHYANNFKFMKAPLLDGIVTWAASLSEFLDQDSIKELFGGIQPLPMVDIGHMDIPGASMIKIDSNSAIKVLMDHLVNFHGYKKFAFVGTDISDPQVRRLLNFQHELKSRNLPQIPGSTLMMNTKMEKKYIDEVFDKLASTFDLHNKKEIDAIITGSDIIGAEGIEQLSRRGINVPSDVAVVGFNNWYESITSRSPLTTIDLVYFKRGYAAVELLIDKILTKDTEKETRYFPTELITRQSCGCREESVFNCGVNLSFLDSPEDSAESEAELRNNLLAEIRKIFPLEKKENIETLLDAFFADIYDKPLSSKVILWFQNLLQDYRKKQEFDSDFFQNSISSLRKIFLPQIKNEPKKTILHLENIFHKLRNLVSVFQKYESISDRENPYQVNNILGHALNFLSVKTIEEAFQVLQYQMIELDIPGVVLALSDNMSHSFPVPKIEFTFPEAGERVKHLMHTAISEPHLFPKDFFTKDKRYSCMLEILHHADYYFGYALFEMKSPNLATYDVLRMLLSNALYIVYRNEGRVKYNSYGIEESQIPEMITTREKSSTKKQVRNRISVTKISEYLSDHINEMTDIDKMAEHFMVSRSYLSKKAKELTGLSIQQLHEKLKIEQAKSMLGTNSLSLAEIASSLGFKNQNYFSTVFKKNTGVSPKAWVETKI